MERGENAPSCLTKLASTRELDPRLRPYAEHLIQVAQASGLRVQLTSTRRTRAQQTLLYQRSQACGGGCLPAARPGTSDHEYGMAFDMVINGDMRGPAQRAVGEYWRSMGGRWPGDADPVHFSV